MFRSAELYLQRGPYFKTLHPIAISDIELEDVAACVTAITRDHGSSTAKLARSYLSRLFAWAMGEGLCTANPVLGSNKPQNPASRERTLTSTEVTAIWHACRDDDFGKIVRLLILTACRREEIGGGLRWSEVDIERATITLPKERTKNGRVHRIALTEPALEILKQARDEQPQGRLFVFGAGGVAGFTRWADSKRALDGRLGAGVAPWRLHDLRRTCATGMGELGVQPHIVEAVLNHYDRKVYNLAQYEREKRDAWIRWATHVTDIAAGRDAKVVPLRSA